MKMYMAFLLTCLTRKRWMASGGFVAPTDAEQGAVCDLADPECDAGSLVLLQLTAEAQRRGASGARAQPAAADPAMNGTAAGPVGLGVAKTNPSAAAGSQAHQGEQHHPGVAFLKASVRRAFSAVAREQNTAAALVITVIVFLVASGLICYIGGLKADGDRGVSTALRAEATCAPSPGAGAETRRAPFTAPGTEAMPGGGGEPAPRRSIIGSRMPQYTGDLPVPKMPGAAVASPGHYSSSSEAWSSVSLASPKLPTIYPQLVMPAGNTRLAIPTEPLSPGEAAASGHTFQLDVLGLSGMPLISASVVRHTDERTIEIALHSISALLVCVTPKLELVWPGGGVIGTISRTSESQHVLRDAAGKTSLLLDHSGGGSQGLPQEVKMLSPALDRREHASAVLRPAGRLPAEHYEVTVNSGVDAVLVVALHLALVVFALPRAPP